MNTSIGAIRGQVVSAPQGGIRVAEYLGIPFAKPPLGRLRYADPVPLDVLPSGLRCCLVTKLLHRNKLKLELCADELVVGGGVGWSYDRRRRRAAHFSSAAAAWLYGRRRQRRRRQTG